MRHKDEDGFHDDKVVDDCNDVGSSGVGDCDNGIMIIIVILRMGTMMMTFTVKNCSDNDDEGDDDKLFVGCDDDT